MLFRVISQYLTIFNNVKQCYFVLNAYDKYRILLSFLE